MWKPRGLSSLSTPSQAESILPEHDTRWMEPVMASPPGKALLSRSNSGSSSMSCCDAGPWSSSCSGGFGPVEGCGVNPFGDARQLERWAPIPPLAGDATRDAAETPAQLWNTDRDTSVADALLRHILLFGEGHSSKTSRSFPLRAPRSRGVSLDYARAHDYAEPSLAPLQLSNNGGGGAAAARRSGSGFSPQNSSSAAFSMSPLALRTSPRVSIPATTPGAPGHTARSKTLPHGLERTVLFGRVGRTTRRTSAPGFATAPLRISEHATRQV